MYGILLKDLLTLTPVYEEDTIYGELLTELVPVNGCYEFKHKRVSILHYMNDRCNDDRSRTVEIIHVDDKPTVYIQYIGRGYYENMEIIDKQMYSELLKLIFDDILKKTIKDLSDEPVEKVTIEVYGANKLDIVDNVLTSTYEEPTYN